MGNYNIEKLQDIFNKVANETSKQPEFNWLNQQKIWKTNDNTPDVQVAVAACEMDFDIWNHNRGPSRIGVHPLTLEQIFSYWSYFNKEKVDSEGRGKMFQTLTDYTQAKKKYKRAIIISAMLPFDEEMLREYSKKATNTEISPLEMYCQYYGQINTLFNKIVARVGLIMYNEGNPVIPMTSGNVDKMTNMVVPTINKDQSNGFCKSHFSHKTISTLTGLTQIGVSRLALRHTVDDKGANRYMGPVLTIIAFDDISLEDSEKGTLLLCYEWQKLITDIADQTKQDDTLNAMRYCRYGDGKCGICIESCPSNALGNSSPDREGNYCDRIRNQTHRFSDGALQFDAATCSDYKGTLSGVFGDWICGRCYVSCGAYGAFNENAINEFENIKSKYTI